MMAKCKKYEITSIDDLVDFAELQSLTYYNGFNDSSDFAMLQSPGNRKLTFQIQFDDVWECKLFESKIKPHCTKFISRKYGEGTNSSIVISNTLKNKLENLKEEKDSYETVLWKLLIKNRGIE